MKLGWQLSPLLPHGALKVLFGMYRRYAKLRHRHSPESQVNVAEFIRRRLEPADRLAIRHRLKLIADYDPRAIAQKAQLPVHSLVGLVDPVVPSLPVCRWLKRNCPGYRGTRVVVGADHNVLGSAPRQSVEQILRWLREEESSARQ